MLNILGSSSDESFTIFNLQTKKGRICDGLINIGETKNLLLYSGSHVGEEAA